MSNDLFLLVDGENMDWQLSDIIGRHPEPDDRIRWNHVISFAEKMWDGGNRVKALFFINVRRGADPPWPFIRVLQQFGFRPVLLTGSEGQKVVDLGILKTLDAITKRPGNVLLLSHDQDFCDGLKKIAGNKRRIGMLVFPEKLGKGYGELDGLEVFDIEHDARAIPGSPLPRLVPVSVEDFDAAALLDSFDRA